MKIRELVPRASHVQKLLRVAAYARVSSSKDAMKHSLAAQVSYFSAYIQKHEDWQYAGVYADRALTGTKDSRPEFQRLIADCRAGEIDYIITKSIARFARNTLTLLETIRELKSLGIGVYFENERIDTMSARGEMALTLLASFAQEESRAVSENCRWRIKKHFAEGKTWSDQMLGYQQIDGVLHVIPEEAEIVKMIFSDYLSGMGCIAIAKKLQESGFLPKRAGKWRKSSIDTIIRNEKYCGSLLLQKTFVADHISKKQRKNNGELPMYRVENSHEAIIDAVTFQRVQEEIARRSAKYHPNAVGPTQYPFTSKIRCEHCGCNFRRKIAGSEPKYKKPVWICPTFNDHGKESCPSKQIPEDILQEITTDILGLSAFDESVFEKKISHIQVPAVDRLVFHFRDGSVVERHWQNRSRRESWSPEMREAARQKLLERGSK